MKLTLDQQYIAMPAGALARGIDPPKLEYSVSGIRKVGEILQLILSK